jgi:hypothetical protein
MKSSSLAIATTVATIAFSALVAAGGPATVTAAAKAAPSPAKQHAEKSSASLKAESVKSEFTLPRKMTDGRDPFFPNSSRPYASETVSKPSSESSLPDYEFSLKGISGSAEQPLAIINNTTFTTGEENEVIIKGKRIRIRCYEINMTAGTVLFEYAGTRRQLKLNH